jgi:signal transduction histidine kinase
MPADLHRALDDEKIGASVYSDFSPERIDEMLAGESARSRTTRQGADQHAHASGGDEVAVVILDAILVSASMERIQNESAVRVIAALVLITAAGGAAVWTLVGPIWKLNEAARRIGQGDLEARVDVEEGMDDELGLLAGTFNEMATAIHSREQELRAQADHLARTNKQLEAARREAEEASRTKDMFVATMSHELRTPLNAIIGMLGLMLYSEELQGENKFMAERCTANAERLLSLINNILDLSRITVGRLEIIPVDTDLRAVAQAIETDTSLRVKEKGLDFVVTVDESLPPRIVHDEERIVQIATNLIGNAIKFTDSGNVHLNLYRSGDRLIIRVSDTGIGIPASKQDIIFDEFTQVDSSSTRSHAGAGLGLAIVKHLTMLMHGSARVESEPGQGSIFTIELPLNLAESKQFAAVD